MLLGRNWVTNGSCLEEQLSYKSDIGMNMAQERGRIWTLSESKWVCSRRIISQKSRNLHLNCTQIARKSIQQESLRSLCPPWLSVFLTPAHERAPPAPAAHLWMSRVGDEHGGRRDDGD